MIVFPMAGLSSRFSKAGYDRPKYMLEAGGHSLFWHSVHGFSALFATHPFLFIYRDIQGTDAFVRAEVARMNIADARFVALSAPTDGQAETVALGLKGAGLAAHEPVTIFNIDTIRAGFALPKAPEIVQSDGWLEVFRGAGANWSFVRPETPGSNRVVEVTEKNPISDLCCTGLYHFERTDAFLEAFEAEKRDGPSQAAEFYVAPLYNRLIGKGADIRFSLIAAEDVEFSGVPDEYEELRRRLG